MKAEEHEVLQRYMQQQQWALERMKRPNTPRHQRRSLQAQYRELTRLININRKGLTAST